MKRQIQRGEKDHLLVTPEWFYQGSMVFKTKERKAKTWIPDKRFRE